MNGKIERTREKKASHDSSVLALVDLKGEKKQAQVSNGKSCPDWLYRGVSPHPTLLLVKQDKAFIKMGAEGTGGCLVAAAPKSEFPCLSPPLALINALFGHVWGWPFGTAQWIQRICSQKTQFMSLSRASSFFPKKWKRAHKTNTFFSLSFPECPSIPFFPPCIFMEIKWCPPVEKGHRCFHQEWLIRQRWAMCKVLHRSRFQLHIECNPNLKGHRACWCLECISGTNSSLYSIYKSYPEMY